ncbi:hypothetical protein M011DRAFT_467331 [Sporormia fimetaria CBS 119925]|uniref:Helicase SWR1 n=1 Tax=Sporormia fimetaria CBS 119925 TaxID=1340428 RepID=A0A6A6VDC4_9PLEO|nr:hypothetical protein M011DRAFT_467331 [Sporormia fimetaria CBS 119925]
MARIGTRRSLRGNNANDGAGDARSAARESREADASAHNIPHAKRRTRSRSIVIPNSSETEDEVIEVDPPVHAPRPGQRVLKSVSIPAMANSKAVSRLSPLSVAPLDREASSGFPSLENSDAETPRTSLSTTPATSVEHGTKPTRRVESMATSAGRSSRKRHYNKTISKTDDEMDDIEEDTSPDALLARQLQHEEDVHAAAANKRRRVAAYDLTDDSDIEMYEEEPEPVVSYKGKGKAKAVDPPVSRGRTRRTSDKPIILDSDEDDEPLSDPPSDDDEFQLNEGESELEDDILEGTPSVIEVEETTKKPKATQSSKAKPKPPKGKKAKRETWAEKKAKQKEGAKRLSRFAHISDRWERKRAMNRERAEENHPKLITMWDDLGKIPVLPVQQAEQPESINRRLKPFQLEGLSWMIRQEKTHYKGGLLGDEMGMGKTIQAVSLIMSDYPAKEPTLVVVPPVALMQWSNEIREYTDGKLKVLVYHGTNAKCKKMSVKELKKFDVIMVSYNSLESLHRKENKGWSRGENIIKEASSLHAIKYHRLILDEAHSIKSRTTGVAKACFALNGTYKWCLSGTPVQNRIGEFFSLLRFLEVRPFADYFCRSCKCEQLHWQVDEDHMCSACNHGGSEHISVFNQELLNPITGDDPALRERALEKLHMITARIMLRRQKRDYTNSMELPMKDIIIHNEFFSDVERDFSTSIMTNSSRKFDTYVAQGVMLNNYANIFGLIMQMRQVANHPDLLLKKNGVEGGQNVFVCNICDEPAEDTVRSRCHHEFCRACVKDYMETCEASGSDADCPRCHIGLSIDLEQPELEQDEEGVKKSSIINRIKMGDWTSSTKIEMLVYDLYKLRSKKQTLKSIVFSQFTSMLQLIEWRLRRAGFNTVMLDGSMTPAMRQKSIEHFMTDPDVEVFLVSLKAGGVALNLTEASRVFIVDPWWNPAAEWQSADRCHRIGQKRPCVITRLCIEDSVESRMVALQEKKAAMIAGTVNNDKVAMDRLSPEDLQFLFRGT